ncbi:hypothetical protein Tco_0358529, partial [Tanacetum coccineum]
EQNEGIEGQNKGTKELNEGTEENFEGIEEEIATQVTQPSTQTPTSKIFGDDETIAKVLLNMSRAKAVSREKEKGVELKDVEETDRPKPTSIRLKRRMNLKVNMMVYLKLRKSLNSLKVMKRWIGKYKKSGKVKKKETE